MQVAHRHARLLRHLCRIEARLAGAPTDDLQHDPLPRGKNAALPHERPRVARYAERVEHEIVDVQRRKRWIAVLLEREQRLEVAVEEAQSRIVALEASL